MRSRPGIRTLFRLPLRRPASAGDEMDEEIRTHLALRTAQLVAQGWTEAAAAAEAERRFGSPGVRGELRAAARNRERVMSLRERLEALRHDLRHAVRQLWITPGMTAMIVLTFALGIGANATMFGIVDRLLLRPPPHVTAPDRIFTLQLVRSSNTGRAMIRGSPRPGDDERVERSWSYPVFQALRDNVGAFEAIAAQFQDDFALGRGERARKTDGALVSGSYFATLGARALLGRTLQPADDALSTTADVAVISERLWRGAFGGDRGAIGQSVELGTGRFTIVGVMPRGFVGLNRQRIDIWVPLNAPHAPQFPLPGWTTGRRIQLFQLEAKLRENVSVERATAQATAVFQADAAAHAEADSVARVRLESVIPARASSVTPEGRVALLLVLVSTLVLLIACANVANLLLTRTLRRRRELAIRLALGISRARLGAQLAMEVMLMAVLGGCAALAIVAWGGSVIERAFLGTYAWSDAAVDGRLIVYAAIATLIVGALASLVPALHGVPGDLSRELRSGMRGGSSRARLRTTLLIVQATLSVVLLAGAGVFVRSFRNATAIRLGFDVDQLLVASVDLQGAGFSNASAEEILRQMQERLEALPEIGHTAIVEGMPFQSSIAMPIALPGRDSIPGLMGRDTRTVAVTHDYFATSGTPILRGRSFVDRSDGDGTRVAVVNDVLARALWPNADPLGRCIKVGSPKAECSEVIGVAPATRTFRANGADAGPQVYLPFAQGIHMAAARALIIRPRGGEPERQIARVRKLLQTVVPNLPFVQVEPMRSLMADDLRPWRLGATLFSLFGGLAVVLAAVGLYGVTSYLVGQRMPELGVRLALGAQPSALLRLVVGQGLTVVGAGTALGIVLALVAARFIESLLFQVSARDPAVLSLVALTMMGVALAACLVPAMRAARADPLDALRGD